ncbi:molybdenum cofactor sulfurase isoform X12 [Cucumis melo var. makuwa]|uniref:Molybdenum cofactor sulfurase isoform X12 n=1 Tax=Cucumis melo var. makuwa TaxID=1194695 RepID=A0A5D3CE57_CUCMM|nr:molybdenum cofactor sulfurase isoform X12 [Cucumis melo var. makuwa]
MTSFYSLNIADAAKLLKRTYFSGGTVAASIADINYVKRREGIEELFEDGTIPFLSIASLCHGFKVLNSLTIPAISRHTSSLATYLRDILVALRHPNGTSVCTIYGSRSSKVFGVTLTLIWSGGLFHATIDQQSMIPEGLSAMVQTRIGEQLEVIDQEITGLKKELSKMLVIEASLSEIAKNFELMGLESEKQQ